MLDLPDPLYISPSLHGFMAVVRCVKLEFPVGWSIGVEYPYVENARWYRLPQKPWARLSSRAPSSVLVEARGNDSPVNG